jgi:hypothetical protein
MKKALFILTMALTTLVNAFTYQGELSQTGSLVIGTADIKFSLLNADTGGSMVGGVDLHTAVVINNGRFVVDLDQWVALYDGTPLWLEIEVDIGSTGNFTTLSPRQKLQPAPYAEYAYDAAGGSNGDITGVVAGTGLTGGGVSGSVTLNVDPSVFQKRINATCPAGQSIRSINENSVIICEIDDTLDATTVWSTTGNSSTNPATNFIGTTDYKAFEIKVNNQTAFRIEPKTSGVNVIAGYHGNSITNVVGAVISGGGSSATLCTNNNCKNMVTADYSTISGGFGNINSGFSSVISGGVNNEIKDTSNSSAIVGGQLHEISGTDSFIGGGINNNAIGDYVTITGGSSNSAQGIYSTVSGGRLNTTVGNYGFVPGGYLNNAGGDYSWAGGATAQVRNSGATGTTGGDKGTFIWDGDADVQYSFNSTDSGQFLVRAPGGMWLGNGLGNLYPDTQSSALLINSEATTIPLIIRHDTTNIFKVQTNGGTSIGSDTAADANGLRVLGETNLMDRLGVGTTSPAAQIDVSAPNGTDAVHVRVNSQSKLIVKSNGGTTIGSISSPATNGLRVEGETNLMDVVGIGTTSPNSTFHIDSPNGDIPFRVQISGTTKLKVESNGGVAIGSNYDPVPANGLKVKGNVDIVGSLSKGGGSFKIDHPLDPENKFLYHSFVESPDMMNIYNGNIVTDKFGEAWIEMPEWFEALNMEYRYQLTVIGSFDRAMIAEEIVDNRFLIRTESGSTKVSWQVTGVRQDAWAQKNRIPVEEDKKEQEKGKYLHPKAWNIDKKLAIGYSEE